MSPMTRTPGKPATVKSGLTSIRPPLPCGSPAAPATGAALRPPPQITQRVLIVVRPLSVTWPGPMSVTPVAQQQLDAVLLQDLAA